uniref:H/ACA ribonucleoprotein complex subunit n=1 Tax=Parastrongyloides trichosuri TaxID=131310 RepID=A0A0N4ZUG3_PARTI
MSSSDKKRSEVKIKPMSLRELKEIRKTQKNSGIIIKKLDKHLTFKWNSMDSLDKYVDKYKTSIIGKWISSLNGIVLGCVKAIAQQNCLIIEDQNCLHTDISFYFIIFSPKVGQSYNCTITKVEKKYVLGKLFDIVPCLIKHAPEETSIGSILSFKFVRAEFKGKLAMLSGTYNEEAGT